MRSKNMTWRYSVTATLLLLSPFDLLASLGMDMYLPVVPFMAEAFGTGAARIQLTLTAYLVLLGAGQLVFGPLSDRLGRRPVLLAGGLGYAGASLGLALVSSADGFLGLRIIQAAGASACLVATFATLRDIYGGRAESSVIYGLLGSMLAMVPAVGPLLGTLVDIWLGWRAIFACLAIAMAGAVMAAWLFWPETRAPETEARRWTDLLRPVKDAHFWLYTLCYSAGMGSFFVFFSTAPWLMMGRHGLSQPGFSLLFATVAVAMMIAARLTAHRIARWGSLSGLRVGMGWLAAGALALFVSETLAPQSIASFICAMWLMAVGIAMAIAVAPNGALGGFDSIAGTATAVFFCLGGLLSGGIGTLVLTLLPGGTAWPIGAYGLGLATLVLGLSVLCRASPPLRA